MMDKPTFIDLFAGIGGFSLGFTRAGMQCVAQVEIDEFCQRVLQKNFPNVPKFKDVRDVGKHNLPAADIVVGGFPCQPHSLAGKRKASADDRDLWGEYARIVRELKPEWVVVENVPGLLSSENGRFFGGVLRDLDSSGYDVEWQSIPAAAFGAPHIRERVIICAHSQSTGKQGLPIFTRRPQQESLDPDGLRENVPNPNGAGLQGITRVEFGGVQEQTETPSRGSVDGRDTEKEWWNWWATEPGVGRMVYGVPARVDRIRSLGNSIVPQEAEWIAVQLMQHLNRLPSEGE